MTPGPPRHILLTGFEPFDGDTVNPSGEVAKQLDGRVIGDCVVRSVILPVQHEAARAVVAPLLEAPGLVAVVHLGLAGGRARISLERVAVNVMDYSRPDAHGQVLTRRGVRGGRAGGLLQHAAAAGDPGRADRGGDPGRDLEYRGDLSLQRHQLYDA